VRWCWFAGEVVVDCDGDFWDVGSCDGACCQWGESFTDEELSDFSLVLCVGALRGSGCCSLGESGGESLFGLFVASDCSEVDVV